jgi:hypothetical protein
MTAIVDDRLSRESIHASNTHALPPSLLLTKKSIAAGHRGLAGPGDGGMTARTIQPRNRT